MTKQDRIQVLLARRERAGLSRRESEELITLLLHERVSWRVHLRRDGKAERTVDVECLSKEIHVWRSREQFDVYRYVEVNPVSGELVAEFHHCEMRGVTV